MHREEELIAVNERIRMVQGNIQMWFILLIVISVGGALLSYYEFKMLDQEHSVKMENLEIKNPEAATSR